MTKLFFIYQNAEKVLSAQSIINVVEKGDYIQGFSLSDNGFRTFRRDRVIEFVDIEQDLAERCNFWHINEQHIQNTLREHKHIRKPHNQLEICFTGFAESDKTRLSNLAQSSGMMIRGSVTNHLDFLCCGYNAGLKKIEKARENNILILSEHQFINLVETGEIPI